MYFFSHKGLNFQNQHTSTQLACLSKVRQQERQIDKSRKGVKSAHSMWNNCDRNKLLRRTLRQLNNNYNSYSMMQRKMQSTLLFSFLKIIHYYLNRHRILLEMNNSQIICALKHKYALSVKIKSAYLNLH